MPAHGHDCNHLSPPPLLHMGEGKGGGACVRISVDSLHSHRSPCTPTLALPHVKQWGRE
jgi:hypothetical protein